MVRRALRGLDQATDGKGFHTTGPYIDNALVDSGGRPSSPIGLSIFSRIKRI